MSAREDEWLWGWDHTPGIVSVWSEGDGVVHVWRRVDGALVREDVRFRPWLLLERAEDLAHLGSRLGRDGDRTRITIRELAGPGALRHLVRADDLATLTAAVTHGASARLGHRVGHVRELGEGVLLLAPEEQYLVATGRTYFRDLAWPDVRRMQFDLETTGLDAARDRIFLIAVREPDGRAETLEATDGTDRGEAALIARLVERVAAVDPDVIENHNLHGFDLPFLEQRARILGVPLALGRVGAGLRQRTAQRGVAVGDRGSKRRIRFIAPGRELIDTLDAVRRHDFAARDLPGHGLKAVARHLGLAGPDRELIRGDKIFATFARDPERVRRYAIADVEEVAGLSRTLGGAAFALAQMAPRRYERVADAGAATGVIDPLLVRAYLRAGAALPAHEPGDGTTHSGAALHLFAAGVAHRIVKADVASLYPSLMRAFKIGPARDRQGALLALVDRLVTQRLAAKAAAKLAPPHSAERHRHEGTSAALKLIVNSAYGYLAAGGLTRFADVHAANEVTRRGRETLALMCRELAARGVTLLEADTDGVYAAVPPEWTEADERRAVAEVAALLPPLVQLEFEGRYAAMLSHEPKNYALLAYDGALTMRGVAFRSSRAEPYGAAFLRDAVRALLVGDVPGVRAAYLAMVTALRERSLPTIEVCARVRLTKSPGQYATIRDTRREFAYEAMIASGRTTWSIGERVRVYRTAQGGRVIDEPDEDVGDDDDDDELGPLSPILRDNRNDPRDYDAEHYVRMLRDQFATRLARALAPDDFAVVFADPDQLSLFTPPLAAMRPILTTMIEDDAQPRGT
ncbi:MAG: ribonuclease H-like domain-containing protein [Deltaproteobacteria bacterium]|nr:ribonuclease H-like domain-containing protein [Deltaproteobacteria bacterium]